MPAASKSPMYKVRRSKIHGFGVFATRTIRKGTRVVEYLGDRISHKVADRRYEDKDEDDGHTFLFIVDRGVVIDAGVDGNDARFINHGCDPNCESVIEDRRVFIEAIRTIQPDDTSFLAWAKQHYACVIFNLRTRHDTAGIERTASAFRGLNDAAIRLGGSFYLTYHRWATRAQIEAAYPQFARFLELKRQYDPKDRFTSEWYRHYKALFA